MLHNPSLKESNTQTHIFIKKSDNYYTKELNAENLDEMITCTKTELIKAGVPNNPKAFILLFNIFRVK